MGQAFDSFNDKRRCPSCGGMLRLYADGLLLSCLSCPWAISKHPNLAVPCDQIIRDRTAFLGLLTGDLPLADIERQLQTEGCGEEMIRDFLCLVIEFREYVKRREAEQPERVN